MTYSEYAEQRIDDFKKCLNQYMRDNKPRKCSVDGEIVDNDEVPDEPPVEEMKKCDEFEEKPKCELEPPPVITRDICEIDKCLRDLGDSILHNYYTAKEACAYYNRLVEEKMRDFKIEDIKDLHFALNERIGLVQTSNCNISEASPKMADLTRYLECGVQASKEAIAETRGLIDDYKDKIDAARMQYEWQYDKSIALDAQFAKVLV
ncbi:unnamed protein product [Diatraea saccharalis]|uniref:Uncharacterized protein n=1 Tax=Diatraea saccharalis TaxID=40085 RepID=A0A9N9REC1_9NEOP|nr:unnamed protein product [Diatraea saccharalis]